MAAKLLLMTILVTIFLAWQGPAPVEAQMSRMAACEVLCGSYGGGYGGGYQTNDGGLDGGYILEPWGLMGRAGPPRRPRPPPPPRPFYPGTRYGG